MRARGSLGVFGLALGSSLGCNAILGNEEGVLRDTAAGGAASSVECNEPADCPGLENACQTRACSPTGVCTFTYAAEGTEVQPDEPGDCAKQTCDGSGAIVPADDPTDVPDDLTACTVDSCGEQGAVHAPTSAGEVCSEGLGRVCDGLGACVECNVLGDCPAPGPWLCQQHLCVPEGCGDGSLNGTETDLDCGGEECAPCPGGADCITHTDCSNGQCIDNVCAAPACDDGIENGDETDVDCGGGTCAACPFGSACVAGSDCVGGLCNGTTCAATCTDGERNGQETDVDCGGTVCSADCALGDGCNGDMDCASGFCLVSEHVCDPAHCDNGIEDGGETDEDCGGTCTKGCGVLKGCNISADCAGLLACVAGSCV